MEIGDDGNYKFGGKAKDISTYPNEVKFTCPCKKKYTIKKVFSYDISYVEEK